jgi:hypothetical protein
MFVDRLRTSETEIFYDDFNYGKRITEGGSCRSQVKEYLSLYYTFWEGHLLIFC